MFKLFSKINNAGHGHKSMILHDALVNAKAMKYTEEGQITRQKKNCSNDKQANLSYNF